MVGSALGLNGVGPGRREGGIPGRVPSGIRPSALFAFVASFKFLLKYLRRGVLSPQCYRRSMQCLGLEGMGSLTCPVGYFYSVDLGGLGIRVS